VATANEDASCGSNIQGPCSLVVRTRNVHYACDNGNYDFDTAITCNIDRCDLIDINGDSIISTDDVQGFGRVVAANEDASCGSNIQGPCSLVVRTRNVHYACDNGNYNFNTPITCG